MENIRVQVDVSLEQYIQSASIIHDSLGISNLIVNSKNEIVHASNTFCTNNNMSLTSLIGKPLLRVKTAQSRMYKKFEKQILENHYQIINNNLKMIFLEVTKENDQPIAMVVHKTPIFNADNKCVCLNIQYKKFTIARLANLGNKFQGVNSYPLNKKDFMAIELTRKQQMILYLYARNYSYTEVSSWLSRFGFTISPSAVNKQLAKLKQIFDVSDNQTLKDMSMKYGYDVAAPAEFLPEGSHDITNDVFDLWVC